VKAQRLVGHSAVLCAPRTGLGGIPVEYKGATVPPPDQRRSYS
jgi:hypothetical protein